MKNRGRSNQYTDVEKALFHKYKDKPPKTLKELKKIAQEKAKFGIIDETNLMNGYAGQYLKKHALVDQMLVENKKNDFSYAELKWYWKGDEGNFDGPDLAAWYQVYNQTQLSKNVKNAKK